MSTSSHAQSEPQGAPASGHAPQVVVRAGKTFVCSACGVLVQVPDDVVGRLVRAVVPDSQPPATSEPAEEVPPRAEPASEAAKPDSTGSGGAANDTNGETAQASRRRQARSDCMESVSPGPPAKMARPARPKRPQKPGRRRYVGEIIDGLRVPTADELDRALAWVSFHQQVLDRQGSELNRLKKLLKKQTAAASPVIPSNCTKEVTSEGREGAAGDAKVSPAQADLDSVLGGQPPTINAANERGPP